MTSSSSPPLERGLDTMILVYSLLQGHPAALPCEQFFRSHSGWFSSPLVIAEAKYVLTKVYGVADGAATAQLVQFARGPVVLPHVDLATVTSAFQLADSHGLDLTDAVLLHLTARHGTRCIVTEDQRLGQACVQRGITPVSPLDASLRQQTAAWEAAHLAAQGAATDLAPRP